MWVNRDPHDLEKYFQQKLRKIFGWIKHDQILSRPVDGRGIDHILSSAYLAVPGSRICSTLRFELFSLKIMKYFPVKKWHLPKSQEAESWGCRFPEYPTGLRQSFSTHCKIQPMRDQNFVLWGETQPMRKQDTVCKRSSVFRLNLSLKMKDVERLII